MAQRLGIATDAIATIGDMANDLPMLRAAGLPIAMGNAPDDVKKEARHVTASNEDDGFAKAVDYHFGEAARLLDVARLRRGVSPPTPSCPGLTRASTRSEHDFAWVTWMAGSSPAMTWRVWRLVGTP